MAPKRPAGQTGTGRPAKKPKAKATRRGNRVEDDEEWVPPSKDTTRRKTKSSGDGTTTALNVGKTTGNAVSPSSGFHPTVQANAVSSSSGLESGANGFHLARDQSSHMQNMALLSQVTNKVQSQLQNSQLQNEIPNQPPMNMVQAGRTQPGILSEPCGMLPQPLQTGMVSKPLTLQAGSSSASASSGSSASGDHMEITAPEKCGRGRPTKMAAAAKAKAAAGTIENKKRPFGHTKGQPNNEIVVTKGQKIPPLVEAKGIASGITQRVRGLWSQIVQAQEIARIASQKAKTNRDRGQRLDELLQEAEVLADYFEEEEDDSQNGPKKRGRTKNLTDKSKCKTKVPTLLLRGHLREYQHVGMDWLCKCYDKEVNGILADEMGLGKTIQTIATLCHLAVEKGIWGPHLIVVPTSVVYNWNAELVRWAPGLKTLIYAGTPAAREKLRRNWTTEDAFHVCVVSYNTVVLDIQYFKRMQWEFLVLDEAHTIRNYKSQKWQALLPLTSQARLLLTGTPLQNDLMELWSFLHFLMPHVFVSHSDFKEWFNNPLIDLAEHQTEEDERRLGGDIQPNHISGHGHYPQQSTTNPLVQRLHRILRPFILRRLKKDVEKELPSKTERVVRCPLAKRQQFLYEEFMNRRTTQQILNKNAVLAKSSGDKAAKDRVAAAKNDYLGMMHILLQLRKVCDHPDLYEPRKPRFPFVFDTHISLTLPPIVVNCVNKSGPHGGMYGETVIGNGSFSSHASDFPRMNKGITSYHGSGPEYGRKFRGITGSYHYGGSSSSTSTARVRNSDNCQPYNGGLESDCESSDQFSSDHFFPHLSPSPTSVFYPNRPNTKYGPKMVLPNGIRHASELMRTTWSYPNYLPSSNKTWGGHFAFPSGGSSGSLLQPLLTLTESIQHFHFYGEPAEISHQSDLPHQNVAKHRRHLERSESKTSKSPVGNSNTPVKDGGGQNLNFGRRKVGQDTNYGDHTPKAQVDREREMHYRKAATIGRGLFGVNTKPIYEFPAPKYQPVTTRAMTNHQLHKMIDKYLDGHLPSQLAEKAKESERKALVRSRSAEQRISVGGSNMRINMRSTPTLGPGVRSLSTSDPSTRSSSMPALDVNLALGTGNGKEPGFASSPSNSRTGMRGNLPGSAKKVDNSRHGNGRTARMSEILVVKKHKEKIVQHKSEKHAEGKKGNDNWSPRRFVKFFYKKTAKDFLKQDHETTNNIQKKMLNNNSTESICRENGIVENGISNAFLSSIKVIHRDIEDQKRKDKKDFFVRIAKQSNAEILALRSLSFGRNKIQSCLVPLRYGFPRIQERFNLRKDEILLCDEGKETENSSVVSDKKKSAIFDEEVRCITYPSGFESSILRPSNRKKDRANSKKRIVERAEDKFPPITRLFWRMSNLDHFHDRYYEVGLGRPCWFDTYASLDHLWGGRLMYLQEIYIPRVIIVPLSSLSNNYVTGNVTTGVEGAKQCPLVQSESFHLTGEAGMYSKRQITDRKFSKLFDEIRERQLLPEELVYKRKVAGEFNEQHEAYLDEVGNIFKKNPFRSAGFYSLIEVGTHIRLEITPGKKIFLSGKKKVWDRYERALALDAAAKMHNMINTGQASKIENEMKDSESEDTTTLPPERPTPNITYCCGHLKDAVMADDQREKIQMANVGAQVPKQIEVGKAGKKTSTRRPAVFSYANKRTMAASVDVRDLNMIAKSSNIFGDNNANFGSVTIPLLNAFSGANAPFELANPNFIINDCGKLQVLVYLLRQCKQQGHRCIIFTQFTKMLNIIEQFLNLEKNQYRYLRLDGCIKGEDRQKLVENFNSNEEFFILIASTRVGGVGINLTGANVVIFFDSDWNPAIDRQAMDRAHRIGQTKDVFIFRLISEKTVEENIWRKQVIKRKLDDMVIDQGHFGGNYSTKSNLDDPANLSKNLKQAAHWSSKELLGAFDASGGGAGSLRFDTHNNGMKITNPGMKQVRKHKVFDASTADFFAIEATNLHQHEDDVEDEQEREIIVQSVGEDAAAMPITAASPDHDEMEENFADLLSKVEDEDDAIEKTEDNDEEEDDNKTRSENPTFHLANFSKLTEMCLEQAEKLKLVPIHTRTTGRQTQADDAAWTDAGADFTSAGGSNLPGSLSKVRNIRDYTFGNLREINLQNSRKRQKILVRQKQTMFAGTRQDKNYSREKEFIEDLGEFADLAKDLCIIQRSNQNLGDPSNNHREFTGNHKRLLPVSEEDGEDEDEKEREKEVIVDLASNVSKNSQQLSFEPVERNNQITSLESVERSFQRKFSDTDKVEQIGQVGPFTKKRKISVSSNAMLTSSQDVKNVEEWGRKNLHRGYKTRSKSAIIDQLENQIIEKAEREGRMSKDGD